MKDFLLRKHSFKDTFTANSFLQRDRKHGGKSSEDVMELTISICAQER